MDEYLNNQSFFVAPGSGSPKRRRITPGAHLSRMHSISEFCSHPDNSSNNNQASELGSIPHENDAPPPKCSGQYTNSLTSTTPSTMSSGTENIGKEFPLTPFSQVFFDQKLNSMLSHREQKLSKSETPSPRFLQNIAPDPLCVSPLQAPSLLPPCIADHFPTKMSKIDGAKFLENASARLTNRLKRSASQVEVDEDLSTEISHSNDSLRDFGTLGLNHAPALLVESRTARKLFDRLIKLGPNVRRLFECRTLGLRADKDVHFTSSDESWLEEDKFRMALYDSIFVHPTSPDLRIEKVCNPVHPARLSTPLKRPVFTVRYHPSQARGSPPQDRPGGRESEKEKDSREGLQSATVDLDQSNESVNQPLSEQKQRRQVHTGYISYL